MASGYYITPDEGTDRGVLIWAEDPAANPDASPVGTGEIPSGYDGIDDYGPAWEAGTGEPLENVQPIGGSGEPGDNPPASEDPANEGQPGAEGPPGGEGDGSGDGDGTNDGEGDGDNPDDPGGDYGAGDGDGDDGPITGELNLDDALDDLDDLIATINDQLDDVRAAREAAQDEADQARESAGQLAGLAERAGDTADALDDARQSLDQELQQLLDADPLDNPDAQDQVEDNLLHGLTVGDPVRPFSGSLVRREVDARARADGMDFVFERYYDHQIYTIGPLGPKWRHSFQDELRLLQSGRVLRTLPDGGTLIYLPAAAGTGFTSPVGWNDVLERRSGGFRVRDAHGCQRLFDAQGRLLEQGDRHGRRVQLAYSDGLLTLITDSSGRRWTLAYDDARRLSAFTAPNGAITGYAYDAGRLAAVALPSVDAGAPLALIRYAYSDGDDPRTRHNLAEVRAPDAPAAVGRVTLTVVYGSTGREFNRVTQQTVAGGVWRLAYLPAQQSGATRRLQITNPLGHVSATEFNDDGQQLQHELWTHGLQPGAPAQYLTRWRYAASGLVASVHSPSGSSTEWLYDAAHADFLARTNLLSLRRRPRADASDAESLLQQFRYGAHNQLVQVIDELGRSTDFTLNAAALPVLAELPAITLADGSSVRPQWRWAYAERGRVASRTAPDGTSTVFSYYTDSGRRGLLRRCVVDPDGLALLHEWDVDDMGLVSVERHPDAATLRHEHDARGRRTALYRGNLLATRWQHDDEDRLRVMAERRLDAEGVVQTPDFIEVHCDYDAAGHLSALRSVAGGATLETLGFVHDALGRLVEQHGPGAAMELSAYDERGLLLESTLAPDTALASTRRWAYDADGFCARFESARGHISTYLHDGFGRLREQVDALGQRDLLSHDELGRLRRAERFDAAGICRRIVEYDFAGADAPSELRLARLDTSGQVLGWVRERFGCDAAGQVLRHEGAAGAITQLAFDALGRQREQTDAMGHVRRHAFDGAGRITRIEHEARQAGAVVQRLSQQLTWSAHGQLLRSEDSAGRVQQLRHDSLGNLTELQLDDGSRMRIEHDLLGRPLRRSTLSADGTQHWTEILAYNAEGQVAQVTNAAGHSTLFTHDAQGRLVRIEAPALAAVPGGSTTLAEFGYDACSNLSHIVDARGVSIDQDFDGLEQLVARSIKKPPDIPGPDKEAFGYDALGNLIRTESAGVQAEFVFDSLGALTQSSLNGHIVRRHYSDDGALATLRYPCGLAIDYQLDALGRATELSATLPAANSFPGSDVSGLIARQSFIGAEQRARLDTGNGVHSTWSYDLLGRPQALHTVGPAATLQREWVLRDGQDRVLVVADEPGSAWRAGRDTRGFVTSVHTLQSGADVPTLAAAAAASTALPAPNTQSELALQMASLPVQAAPVLLDSYDDAGNRIRSQSGAHVVDSSFDERDQMQASAGQALLWDAAGNLIDDGQLLYVYDANHCLARLSDKASGTTLYEAEYDPLGRVWRSSEGGRVQLWVYDGEQRIERLDASGLADAALVWGLRSDELLLWATQGQPCYAHADLHGNVALLTDSTGAVHERYRYDASGQRQVLDASGAPRAGSALGNALGYAGRPHLGASALGAAPAGAMTHGATPLIDMRSRSYHAGLGRFTSREPGGFVDGLNPYLYAGNDPFSLVDASGRHPAVVGGALGLSFGVGYTVGNGINAGIRWASNGAYGERWAGMRNLDRTLQFTAAGGLIGSGAAGTGFMAAVVGGAGGGGGLATLSSGGNWVDFAKGGAFGAAAGGAFFVGGQLVTAAGWELMQFSWISGAVSGAQGVAGSVGSAALAKAAQLTASFGATRVGQAAAVMGGSLRGGAQRLQQWSNRSVGESAAGRYLEQLRSAGESVSGGTATHFTDAAGQAGITSSGYLNGPKSAWTFTSGQVPSSRLGTVLKSTVGPTRVTHRVDAINARELFAPQVRGPFSLWQRLSGVRRTPGPGTYRIDTGEFIPGKIFDSASGRLRSMTPKELAAGGARHDWTLEGIGYALPMLPAAPNAINDFMNWYFEYHAQ